MGLSSSSTRLRRSPVTINMCIRLSRRTYCSLPPGQCWVHVLRSITCAIWIRSGLLTEGASDSVRAHPTTNVFLKSLPPEAGLLQVFQAFPKAARPLLEYHEILLRGESAFSPAEREMIAAYVSALNKCDYCRAVHSQTAVALGIDANAISEILSGSGLEHVDQRMQPVLGFVRKLTLLPGAMTAADVDEVFAAGWNDRALHDAAGICGLFNLMNRL